MKHKKNERRIRAVARLEKDLQAMLTGSSYYGYRDALPETHPDVIAKRTHINNTIRNIPNYGVR